MAGSCALCGRARSHGRGRAVRTGRCARDGIRSALLAADPGRRTVDNERLDAALQSQLLEVRASRARLVQASEEERRRLERDLHDGAQQRLVSVGLALQQARQAASSDGTPPELRAGLDAAGRRRPPGRAAWTQPRQPTGRTQPSATGRSFRSDAEPPGAPPCPPACRAGCRVPTRLSWRIPAASIWCRRPAGSAPRAPMRAARPAMCRG